MISVVVPTRNRAGLLNGALHSVACQTFSQNQFEVVVVDNGSTDGTRQVIDDHSARLPKLRGVHEPLAGLHYGRHRGLREAEGDILVFIDDDIEATPGWLASLAIAFEDPEVVMVGGNNLPLFEDVPPPWLLRLWNRPVFGGQAIPWLSILRLADGVRPIDPMYVWGCNFAIRRQTLLNARGFHPDAMPRELIRLRGDGETHVSRYVADAGLKCLFHSGATVFHHVGKERMTFDYSRQRAFDQGISDSYSDLRRSHLAEGGRETPWHGIKPGTLFALRWLRSILERDLDLRRLRRSMASGYREGYAFHQRAFRQDAALRAWVTRPDYWIDEEIDEVTHD